MCMATDLIDVVKCAKIPKGGGRHTQKYCVHYTDAELPTDHFVQSVASQRSSVES